jgi:histidine triad (HIT) family protein
MEETIYNKIIRKEIPTKIIYEDKNCLAFLDHLPFSKGHTLVIPKKRYEYIADMPESEYLELQKIVLKIVKHYRKIFNCKIGTFVYGEEVPHVHIHIFPITKDIKGFDLQSRNKWVSG